MFVAARVSLARAAVLPHGMLAASHLSAAARGERAALAEEGGWQSMLLLLSTKGDNAQVSGYIICILRRRGTCNAALANSTLLVHASFSCIHCGKMLAHCLRLLAAATFYMLYCFCSPPPACTACLSFHSFCPAYRFDLEDIVSHMVRGALV